MKAFIVLLLFISFHAKATYLPACPQGTFNAFLQTGRYSCVPRMTPAIPDYLCNIWGQPILPFSQFPSQIYQPQVQPWWATQGNLYYPNVRYPGPWQYPGIQSQYYPGQGEVFAAKPNVYIDSIHTEKKFSMKFTSEKPSFLATTPGLEEDNSWKGKILKDLFEVDGVNYDYLFYDVRLPKEKMQFENGICATKEGMIEYMLKDLKELGFSAIAIQDFEGHWRVKIPEYPYYCMYPQYNRELDAAFPVEISTEQTSFTRALYVLVPHKEEPDISNTPEIPFPTKDPVEFRPEAKIKREVMFREWGVAFLGY